jgi:hypothetical protein
MDCQEMVMTVIQDRHPRHQLGARHLSDTLKTAIRGVRKVQDEQTRMWNAFYRVEPSAPARKPPAGKSQHDLPGPDPGQAADGGNAQAA